MPRSIWNGVISFGMVSIPVKLYTATESKDVSFHLLHKKHHTRIKQQRYCPTDDGVVEWGDVVRGYEYGPDQYVIMDEEDFQNVPVNTTHTIEITDFVQLDEIDPIYYEKTYYLEPEAIAAKPFALLRQTLSGSQRVAIAKVTLRQKEQLCTLRVRQNTIALETMFYADEIRSAADLEVPAEDIVLGERELEMAQSLVDMLTGEFDPTKYHAAFRDALLKVIEKKAAGAEITRPVAAPSKVTDLMEALRASIEAAKRTQDGEGEEVEKERKPARRARAVG